METCNDGGVECAVVVWDGVVVCVGLLARVLSLLSLIFITRVAPHCVNTLKILHVAHTLIISAG